jgi:hypothetical protein
MARGEAGERSVNLHWISVGYGTMAGFSGGIHAAWRWVTCITAEIWTVPLINNVPESRTQRFNTANAKATLGQLIAIYILRNCFLNIPFIMYNIFLSGRYLKDVHINLWYIFIISSFRSICETTTRNNRKNYCFGAYIFNHYIVAVRAVNDESHLKSMFPFISLRVAIRPSYNKGLDPQDPFRNPRLVRPSQLWYLNVSPSFSFVMITCFMKFCVIHS